MADRRPPMTRPTGISSSTPPASDVRPTVLVITPTLNSAATVEETILSVRNQTYPAVTHLVIDGGSSDGTLEILRHHQGDNFAYISEPDLGIADAFNKGITIGGGDLIGILNSDDTYVNGAMDHVVEMSTKHPQAVIHGDAIWVDGDLETEVHPSMHPGAYRYFDMPFLHPTCFVPRSVYDHVGLFNQGYRLAMDYEWVLRAMNENTRFEYLPKPITRYRAGGRAISDAQAAHLEVLRAQLSLGLNPIVCRAVFLIKLAAVSIVPLATIKASWHALCRAGTYFGRNPNTFN